MKKIVDKFLFVLAVIIIVTYPIWIIPCLFIFHPLVSLLLGNFPSGRFNQKIKKYFEQYPELRPGGPYIILTDLDPQDRRGGFINAGITVELSQVKPSKPLVISESRFYRKTITVNFPNPYDPGPYDGLSFHTSFESYLLMKQNVKHLRRLIEDLLPRS